MDRSNNGSGRPITENKDAVRPTGRKPSADHSIARVKIVKRSAVQENGTDRPMARVENAKRPTVRSESEKRRAARGDSGKPPLAQSENGKRSIIKKAAPKSLPVRDKDEVTVPETIKDEEHTLDRESVSAPREMTLSDKIYRTPAVYVAALSAAAGVAFCVLAFLILLLFGLRVYTDTNADGETYRYCGIMSGGRAVCGTLYAPDGESAWVFGSSVRFSDKTKYKGEMDGLFFEGDGVFTDADGNAYKGNFVDGRLEGEGSVEYADGGTFNGSFLGGKFDGYGEYLSADGVSSYKGYYAEGEKSGYGVLVYPDGSVYEGYFQNGMRHGQGIYRFASGDRYTGEFRNNVIWGQGSYFFASGRVFTGEFRNGIPQI